MRHLVVLAALAAASVIVGTGNARADCWFQGMAFSPGALSCQFERVLRCKDNSWEDTGESCRLPSPPTIKIEDAAYGSWQVDRFCNARSTLQVQCDGRAACQIKASDDLCGNPVGGIRKELRVRYACIRDARRDRDPRFFSLREGEIGQMTCN